MCEPNYCGCCGRQIENGWSQWWCDDCLKHIGSEGPPLWDRTYAAIHGVECPYQVSMDG